MKTLETRLEIDDDEWAPAWITGNDDWLSDKPELYFDLNAVLHNGEGASMQAEGHYLIAPNYSENNAGSTMNGTFGQGYSYEYANTYNGEGYSIFEYKIPFSSLIDNTGAPIDPPERTTIGFDVVMNDNTPSNNGRNRMVWSNNGAADYDNNGNTGENWHNLDDAGELVFDFAGIPGTANRFVSYSINGYEAVISGQSITVILPPNIELTNLIADFVLSNGANAYINGVVQESGVTVNNLTSPLTYTVIADDGSEKEYNVKVEHGLVAGQITVNVKSNFIHLGDSILLYAAKKIDYYKKVVSHSAKNTTYNFKVYSSINSFESKKPVDLPEHETTFFEEDTIHVISPTTIQQTAVFSSFRQVVENALAKKVIYTEYSGNIGDWLLYGFGLQTPT